MDLQDEVSIVLSRCLHGVLIDERSARCLKVKRRELFYRDFDIHFSNTLRNKNAAQSLRGLLCVWSGDPLWDCL
jgi:hypothetical protein